MGHDRDLGERILEVSAAGDRRFDLEATGYRDGELLARRRLAELLTRTQEQLRDLGAMARLHGRRVGRIAGGATATVLGLVFLATSLATPYRSPWPGITLLALMGAWSLGLLAAAIGRGLGRRHLLLEARALVRPTGDLHRDLARLEAMPQVARVLAGRIVRLEAASLALPLTAVALLAPLTLHLPFSLGAGGLASVDQWSRISAMVVGHAHLVLAGLFVRHALRLRRADNPRDLRGKGWLILWLTVAAAAIPGIMLLALPPVITLITGVLFVPYAAGRAADLAVDERDVLAAAIGSAAAPAIDAAVAPPAPVAH